MKSGNLISIIAPIFNELENLPILYQRISEVMEKSGSDWELLLVDDGSTMDRPTLSVS